MKSRAALANTGKRPGFTALELLIVVAIMALFLFFSVPIALRFYQNREVDEAARSLQETLLRAREYSMAARNDASFGVKLVTSSHAFVLFQGSSYTLRTKTEDENIAYPTSLSINATSTEVVFSRLYGTSTISDIWSVTDGGTPIQLTIPFSGLVEIQ